MKKRMVVVAVGVALLIVIFAWRHWHRHQSASLPSAVVNVEVAAVSQHSIDDQIVMVGNVEAKHVVDVSPMLDGQVAKVLFEPGQAVKKGDPLVKLDDSAIKADYQTAVADKHLSELNLDRAKKLTPTGAMSQQDLDRAEADYDDQVGMLAAAKAKLDYMTLTAPFDGVVGPQVIHVGEFLPQGQVAVSLVDSENLQVSYQVPESDIAKLKMGQSVTVTSDAYPGVNFAGQVFFIDEKIDPDTRTIEVQANVKNSKNQLTPGMFVEVKQVLTQVKDAMVIPIESLMPDITGQSVYRVTENKVELIPVSVGTQNASWVQVTKGLAMGDVVVTAGQQKLRNGSVVKVVKSTSNKE